MALRRRVCIDAIPCRFGAIRANGPPNRQAHLLPWRSAPANCNVAAATRQCEAFFRKAMDNYERVVG